MKKRSVLAHAGLMVGRQLRSYALLSVTVVLSLSLLLAYMMYNDSQLYNKYKVLFSHDPNLVEFYLNRFPSEELFFQNAEELGEIYDVRRACMAQMSYGSHLATEDGVYLGSISMEFLAVDSQSLLPHYLDEHYDVVWLDGVKRDYLEVYPGEVILDEELFYALRLNEQEDPIFIYETASAAGSIRLSLRVVGLLRATSEVAKILDLERFIKDMDSGNGSNFTADSIVNAQDISPTSIPWVSWGTELWIYCESPSEIAQLAEKMYGDTANLYFSTYCYADQQAEALQTIRTEKGTKATIAMALLLLLGINLYSCFSNALSERKFEIGVKRALGASKWSIVRQFLYEGFMIMTANILISIDVVTLVLLLYKRFCEANADNAFYGTEWTIYFSPYTFGIFAVCAVTLTVVFSLIFAYQSTQVEIVQYLKAE